MVEVFLDKGINDSIFLENNKFLHKYKYIMFYFHIYLYLNKWLFLSSYSIFSERKYMKFFQHNNFLAFFLNIYKDFEFFLQQIMILQHYKNKNEAKSINLSPCHWCSSCPNTLNKHTWVCPYSPFMEIMITHQIWQNFSTWMILNKGLLISSLI